MITIADVKKLSELSRIELSEQEQAAFVGQLDSILGYIDQIKQAAKISGDAQTVGDLHNVMRPDINAHESGMYTEQILNEAPAREGNYLKVKKIL